MTTPAPSPTAPRRARAPETGEGSHRFLVVAIVLVAVVSLLVAGSVVKAHRPIAAFHPSSAVGFLPSSEAPAATASAWDCPGPLPAGQSARHSQIEVLNEGDRAAHLRIAIASTLQSPKGGSSLPAHSLSATVAGHANLVVPLPGTGPAVNDAVSVVSDSSAIAVFESALPSRPKKAGSYEAAPSESACELGSSAVSYIASGSTSDLSSVLVSIFDPSSTEAVVGVKVSTGTSSTSPPALQGLTIRPDSLETYNIGAWVVQHETVALSVTTTVGRVAVGASEIQSSASTMGQALVIADYSAAPTWFLTPGLTVLGRTVGIRLYDPSSRPTTVTILSPVTGGPSVNLTAAVPAGGVVTVTIPVRVALPRSPRIAPIVEGPIVVRSSEGVGVVVARLGAGAFKGSVLAVSYMEDTAAPARDWVLPAVGPAGLALVVVNPSSAAVTVRVDGASAGGGAKGIAALVVPAESRKTLVLGPASYAAYQLSAPTSVLVEGALYASEGRVTVPSAATPVQAVPVLG